MAFSKQIDKSRIVLKLENGQNELGETSYVKASYNRVREAATDEAVQATGAAIGSLHARMLAGVIRIDEASLSDAE